MPRRPRGLRRGLLTVATTTMSLSLVTFALASILAAPAPVDLDAPAGDTREDGQEEDGQGGLRAWLQRPVPVSARFLDHGVVAVGAAGGVPHRYRVEVLVGVLDHLTIGATAHWLPGQTRPQVWPVVALAAYRGRVLELGAHYRPVLHPPVGAVPTFVPRTHLGLGSVVLSAGYFSAGLDAGVAHVRAALTDPQRATAFGRRTVFGGGVTTRVGTRRWGVRVDLLAALTESPLLIAELGFDWRFGAFELRPR